MSLTKLPPHVSLRSANPVALSVSTGKAVVVEALEFPDFFVSSLDLSDDINRSAHPFSFDHWPAVISDGVVATDPSWAVFGSFFDQYKSDPSWILIDSVSKGKSDWKCTCPVIRGHASLIGNLIAQYGAHMGADPNRPGYNPNDLMLKNPIEKMLRRAAASELVNFNDRGHTLLDLAMMHQQWDLADFLWDKGVRWSDKSLATGEPLEGLITATRALQGSLATGFLRDFKVPDAGNKRVEWLTKWLNRWEQTGAAPPSEPSLDWRSKRAQNNNWGAGIGLRDTPASLWACMFIESQGPAFMMLSRAPDYTKELVGTWAKFWARQDVDMSSIEIAKTNEISVRGLGEYWNDKKNAPEWVGFIQSEQQAAFIRSHTQSSNLKPSSSGPRL